MVWGYLEIQKKCFTVRHASAEGNASVHSLYLHKFLHNLQYRQIKTQCFNPNMYVFTSSLLGENAI